MLLSTRACNAVSESTATLHSRHWPSLVALLLLSLLIGAGCTSQHLKDNQQLDAPAAGYAQAPSEGGTLAAIAQSISLDHSQEHSGFHLLDGSFEALQWRIALIDSAVSSVDIQTYLWYPDNTGRLILERAVAAANRGIKVRMIVDDLLTIGQDQLFIELENHPNIEFRLFNPWSSRGNMAARGAEMIAEMERLNSRMHDKLIIVDGNAVVIGGRNLGDHYFGLSHAYNFHDLDLLGIGYIARQCNAMFDHFWNSDWVVSAQYLPGEPDAEFARETWARIQRQNRSAAELASFPLEVKDWSEELAQLQGELRIGTSQVAYDEASSGHLSQKMIGTMFGLFGMAKEELLITNAYVIPAQKAIDFVDDLGSRGVDVRILTNSLASHDVPAVNSHYKQWRDDFINAGVQLYELRADADIKSIIEVPPVSGEFTGLHTKAAVVDRRLVFVGSMNLDPRSSNINTEMGAFIDSPELGEDLARIMLRDMQGENAWQVLLDESGKPYWVNSDETVYEQPARSGTQRIMDVIFKVVPKEQN